MSSHISTLNDVLNLRYRPHYTKYKDLYYTQQNHLTVMKSFKRKIVHTLYSGVSDKTYIYMHTTSHKIIQP